MDISIKKNIFAENDALAESIRADLADKKLVMINVMASPGAGKTSLIIELLKRLPKESYRGVIEGDVASSIDTDKIKALGFNAFQINTGGSCHLTSEMVEKGLAELKATENGFVFIENIGNLICTASFDLGESIKMVISSVPEGDDKPVKYPHLFQIADIIVLTKIDLLKAVDFEQKQFVLGVRSVNPDAAIIEVSVKTGAGLDELIAKLTVL